jgi:tetratricopeptide (TPR) repeat protein
VQIQLDRLSRRDRMAMIERVAGSKKLPEFVLEQIISKTDGVPLFVEELTRTVLEGGILRDAGNRYELAGPFQGISIPDTLQGSLLSRLDRLPPEAREVAQIGAVIGREFGRDLLALVTDRSAESLDNALSQLVAAEIIQPAPRSTLGAGAYAFRHALIQEAAYHSLLLARRRQYHAAIAKALSGSFPGVAAMLPEIVAQHLTAAELVDRAVDAWALAGEKATKRGAFVEALAHLERGTELVRRLPESERARRMVPLLLARAWADAMIASPRALSTYREIAGMARAQGLTNTLVAAALGFTEAELYLNRPTAESVALLEEALAAVGTGETIERCRLLGRLPLALLYVGESDRAREFMPEAHALVKRFHDIRSLRQLLTCELSPNFAAPVSAAGFDERRRKLKWLRQLDEDDEDSRHGANLFGTRVSAFLELGDVDELEAIARRFERMTAFSQSWVDKWAMACLRAMDAILKGDFLAAERLAIKALELGNDSDISAPLGIYGMQMFTIRREQGRLAEVAPLFKRFVQENPDNAAWQPGLMLIASDLGFVQQAQKTFNTMAATGFALPLDSVRTVTLSYLAEVCCRLDDRINAERLYALLLPYRDLAVVAGQSTVCGAAGRFLGMLAATMRDWPTAESHFEAALTMDERMKAWPWLAHTRFEYARALLARDQKGDRVHALELRGMALAAAERLEMGGLSRRILTEGAPA